MRSDASYFFCCRRKSTSDPQNANKNDNAALPTNNNNINNSPPVEADGTTSALIETFLPLILPIIRVAISKQLIRDGCVLRDEIPIPIPEEHHSKSQLDKDIDMDESQLPIGPIEISIGHILVQESKTVLEDMAKDSQFGWPEKDHVEDLMKVVPGYGRKMIVLDFCDLQCQIPLGKGIELVFPMNMSFMGSKVTLEVGSGKGVPHAWVRLMVPKLRLWFVTSTRKLYVAFMKRPQLVPNLHVNLDRGKGDFMDLVLQENGSLDEVVETVLCSFGPKNLTSTSTLTSSSKNHSKKKETSGTKAPDKFEDNTNSTSWVGNALGGIISHIVLKSMSKTGERRPLEIDLSEVIQSSLNAALGIPRSVEVIQADMAMLEKELEAATKLAQQQQQQQQGERKEEQVRVVAASIVEKRKSTGSTNSWSLF